MERRELFQIINGNVLFPLKAYTIFINGGRVERPGFECLKTRPGRL